jgi:peptidoglycan hydrolase CwlO-like protein
MARRLQITGFARFLIVMVILAPAAYIGASYYNGQDGIQNFKNLIGIDSKSAATADQSDNGEEASASSDDVTALVQKNQELESTVETLVGQLEKKNKRIEELEAEIAQLKASSRKRQ